MTVNKFIRKLLNLKDLSVTGFKFVFKKRELHLWVKPYKNGCRCPHCNRRGRIVRTMDEPRTWRDLPIGRWSVFFRYHPREIFCPTHNRIQENIPGGLIRPHHLSVRVRDACLLPNNEPKSCCRDTACFPIDPFGHAPSGHHAYPRWSSNP